MTRALFAGLLLAGAILAGLPARAAGQGWSLELAAGRIVYDPVSVNVGTNNVMASLRYDALRGAWVYGTAAAPLRTGDPLWTAFGAGGRFERTGTGRLRAGIGADLGTHGFVFRDAVVDQSGRGGTIEALPFAGVDAGDARLELRGGWRGQTLAFAGVTERRGVFETGVRGTYGTLARLRGDLKWVHADEGTFPFVGGSFIYGGSPVSVWVQTGKWLSEGLDEVMWGAGAGVSLGARATLWAAVAQEAPDPLYWNAPRRTWNVGFTQRLGRIVPLLPAPRSESGGVVIRVPAADAPGDALFIAGDFNQWQPTPMLREGTTWVIRLPLAPGVYNYAFRSERGEWFVPSSVAGRRDDGMGGHVAVLVVG